MPVLYSTEGIGSMWNRSVDGITCTSIERMACVATRSSGRD